MVVAPKPHRIIAGMLRWINRGVALLFDFVRFRPTPDAGIAVFIICLSEVLECSIASGCKDAKGNTNGCSIITLRWLIIVKVPNETQSKHLVARPQF
jgi:hypothetical protein